MHYKKAQDILQDVLNNQQTVSTRKLKRLLTDLNFSPDNESKEKRYLKNEIRKLVDRNKELKAKLKTKNKKIERMKRK